MARLSAREALEYAISPAVLRLFAVVAVGALLLPAGLGLFRGYAFLRGPALFVESPLVTVFVVGRSLLGLALTVVGFLALYGGLVALLYKVLVDARRASPEA